MEMNLSEIAKSIGESATLVLNAKAAALRASKRPVIHLGGGEPKSKAPGAAIARAAEVIASGEVRYPPTAGIPELREAIVEYTEKMYGHEAQVENVMAAGGSKHALMCCLQAVLNPGDEVVFPAPYWVSYPEMVKLCGARPVAARAAGGGLRADVDDIERATTDATKAVIINSPNNPSGLMFSGDFIRGVVEHCEARGLYLIMDDIYHRLIFDGIEPVSCYKYAEIPGEGSRLVVINGVSKQYAMTGFRLGWSVADAGLTKVMTDIQSHVTSGSSMISQWAAVGALTGSQDCVVELRRTLESNRDVLLEALNEFPRIGVTKPDGTFYCFVDFREYDEDSTRLSNFLLEKALVVTVPGVEFGMDGFLRISYCGSVEEIVEGVRRMRWALDSSSPVEIDMGGRTIVRDWS
jgi:aspartate aminotransferase